MLVLALLAATSAAASPPPCTPRQVAVLNDRAEREAFLNGDINFRPETCVGQFRTVEERFGGRQALEGHLSENGGIDFYTLKWLSTKQPGPWDRETHLEYQAYLQAEYERETEDAAKTALYVLRQKAILIQEFRDNRKLWGTSTTRLINALDNRRDEEDRAAELAELRAEGTYASVQDWFALDRTLDELEASEYPEVPTTKPALPVDEPTQLPRHPAHPDPNTANSKTRVNLWYLVAVGAIVPCFVVIVYLARPFIRRRQS